MARINTEVTPSFERVIERASDQGLSVSDISEITAAAIAAAEIDDDQEASRLLRSIVTSERPPLDTEFIRNQLGGRALGIHMGSPLSVINCPFGRTEVGIDPGTTDPFTLVDMTFAEWKTAQTSRKTVIFFKLGTPVLLYRDVVWVDSPPAAPGHDGRDFHGRHYIASGEVTVLETGEVFDFWTDKDSDGMVRPYLSPRSTNAHDDLVQHLQRRSRARKSITQPIDLLDM